ncbi:hypothetical protein [Streptomyces tsukubensis]|uniref:hypothetical protein n=1 Tax=Streptomyces tsukubensis TaxID=83656 RepID=UPI00344D5673
MTIVDVLGQSTPYDVPAEAGRGGAGGAGGNGGKGGSGVSGNTAGNNGAPADSAGQDSGHGLAVITW